MEEDATSPPVDPPPPAIEVLPCPEGSALVLRGRLGVADAAALHRAAREAAAGAGDVVVRGAEAEHLGLCALQVLAALGRALADRGAALRWEAVAEPVAAAIELAGLDAHLAGGGARCPVA